MDCLELAGLLLWWAEGSKSRRDKRWKGALTYPIEVTNTDSRIISIFLKFMYEVMNVEPARFSLQLQVHEGDDKGALEEYWARVTGIPLSRFQKTIIRPAGNKPGKSKGTCKVRFSDKVVYNALDQRLKLVLRTISGIGAVG